LILFSLEYPYLIINSLDFNLKRSGFSSGGKKNSIEDGKSTPEKKSSVESKRLEKNINEEITKVLDKQGAGDVAEEAAENDALTSGKRVTNLKVIFLLFTIIGYQLVCFLLYRGGDSLVFNIVHFRIFTA